MTQVPTFRTNRLMLRELTLDDADNYQNYFADYEVIRHLTASVPWPYPSDGAAIYLRDEVVPNQGRARWVWAITLADRPTKLIGSIELLREATPTNRGFWLGREFWGRGYMTEALVPVTDYAFTALGFKKLLFGNAIGNRRSSRIKEKAGAKLIKTIPSVYVDNAYSEKEIYELTLVDWESQRRIFEDFSIE